MTSPLESAYYAAYARPSDINEHLSTLRKLATGCAHVTEMGVRHGVSTLALLAAQPTVMRCYDIGRYPEWDGILAMRGATDLSFTVADTRTLDIEPTDFLFIDTYHVYEQLQVELARHAPKVRRAIALHDTVTFGQRGENGGRGLWPAVEEYVALGTFRVAQHYTNNNGLTVLERAAP